MDTLGRIDAQADDDGVDSPGENGRTRKRDSLFLSARLRLAESDTTHDVRVRNLSAGGLMAEYESNVRPGMALTLTMRGLGEITGAVAWCTRGRLGIAFDHPIDPARARTPIGTGTGTPHYAKPLIVQTSRR